MAKSLHAIQMDFSRALSQADSLEQAAKGLESLLNNNFYPCQRSIAERWKGTNANSYYNKGVVIGDRIRQSVQDLRNAADTIRQIAGNIFETERLNYEIAQMRTYKG